MSNRRARAFTLIELLVVVVIVGIVSGIVLLSLGLISDDRDVEQEVRRLASLIALAEDEALLQGRDYGLEFTRTGYRFVEHDPYLNQWHEITGDDLLRSRTLPESMYFELYVEDRRVALNAEAVVLKTGDDDNESVNRNKPAYAPHALMLSSGDMTPLQLELHRETDRALVTLTVDPAGDIVIGDDDDDAA